MDIGAWLAIDWVGYVSEAALALIALVTVVDKIVAATPTKRDDEFVKPVTSKLLAFLAHFSMIRGKR